MDNRKRTQKTVEELNIIDDVFFHKMVEDIEFCEEMLSTILQQEVTVIETTPQSSIKNLQGRSVILDAKCVLEDGTTCDVEVQKENDDDNVRRVRYNAACLTSNIASPGIDFKEVPNVIMIFISKFDIFKLGKTIYHIDRVIRETGDVNYNGLQEIYVNTKIDDGSSIAELMKIFKEEDTYDFEKFPKTSTRKGYFKTSKGGRKEMCEIVENYAREYAKEVAIEAAKETAKRLFENGADFEIVKKSIDLSEEILKEIYDAMHEKR